MAQAHGEQIEHTTEGAEAAEHASAGGDPMEHIVDSVLLGIDVNGHLVRHPYGEDHRPVAGYAPKMLGPIKLEFTKHMADVGVVAALFFVVAMLAARSIARNLRENKAPSGRLPNLVEAIIVFVRDEIVVPVGGKHLGHYTPLFLTYFLFILLANLLGMIPEVGSATGDIGVTLALGGSVYAIVWVLGIAHQGPLRFVLNMVPPGTPWWMWPLMLFLELLGPLIKCAVLCVRLFANMIAGHLIIGTVLSLGAIGGQLSVGLAAMMLVLGLPLVLGISMLELLVALIQAYVFTLLAVVFIGAAVHPEH